jgi:hypothetical protein
MFRLAYFLTADRLALNSRKAWEVSLGGWPRAFVRPAHAAAGDHHGLRLQLPYLLCAFRKLKMKIDA